ncbi:MAG: oligopeptide/dipeptide ABC transporter ATP-binding protein [Planctomycetota bacterium]|nr:oligopeptide/dipeptide ABC transporter ATP-binding protein [Planctomycetota bacterium]
MNQDTQNSLVAVSDLKTFFPVRGGWFNRQFVRAVDGVSFSIRRGETLALVGESGSGKTTVGRTILKLIPATSGLVSFDGIDLFSLPRSATRTLRRKMQIIFQDPVGSLNPRMTVGSIVGEPIKVHRLCDTRRARRQRVAELLGRVGLDGAHAKRYPHEFSGGQRQRIGIARALASRPEFIVCDEPVSALDVSIQAQILNLLDDLQDEFNLTYLFIAHNLAVVEHFADAVAVMYLGRIVEIAGRDDLYVNPQHPYTISLFSAVPHPDPNHKIDRIRLEGEVPSPINPPTGCCFHPRCPLTRQKAADGNEQTCQITVQSQPVTVVRKCVEQTPELLPMTDNPSHCHACHLKRP